MTEDLWSCGHDANKKIVEKHPSNMKRKLYQPGVVAHACNPSTLGG